MTMIEKVARAIHEKWRTLGSGEPPWDQYGQAGKAFRHEQARAAIEAMREPTMDVLKAVRAAAVVGVPMGRVQPPFCNEASRISEDEDMMLIGWKTVIDAALSEKP